MGIKFITDKEDTIFDIRSEIELKIKLLESFSIPIDDVLLETLYSFSDYFSLERYCKTLIRKRLNG